MKNQTLTIENNQLKNGPSMETSVALIQRDISSIRADVSEIKESLKTDYVTKDQFKPVEDNYVDKKDFNVVKGLVFGFTTLILSAVVMAWIGLVVLKVKI